MNSCSSGEAEKEQMRKQMREELLAQMEFNAQSMMSWDEKVIKSVINVDILLLLVSFIFTFATWDNFIKLVPHLSCEGSVSPVQRLSEAGEGGTNNPARVCGG